MIGVDPGPLTLRQLMHMLDGHEADQYSIAALLATVANRLAGNGASAIRLPVPKLCRPRPPKPADKAQIKRDLQEARKLFEQHCQQRKA